ncbi:hypothetical protein NHX12_017028, partial [Muraenolepis orangiensis]
MYMRELGERNLDRAMAMDKVTIGQPTKEGSLPKITMPNRGRDPLQDMDSDQESLGNVGSSSRRNQAKVRRHTLPPILPELERKGCFLIKNSAVRTPPPIHINGQGNRESSEAGVDGPLSRKERQQILKGVHSITVKAAHRHTKALEVDAL